MKKLYFSVIASLVILVCIFCLGCNGGGKGESTSSVKLDEPVQFTIKTYEGDTLTPEDFRGKVLIVDYWATWCAPCRAEFKHFEKLLEVYGDDLAIIGITTDEDINALDNFLADNPQKFIIGMDAQSDTPSWGKKPPAMPTTFYIDRDGILVSFMKGGHKYEELNAQVEPLINKPAAVEEDTGGETTEESSEEPLDEPIEEGAEEKLNDSL